MKYVSKAKSNDIINKSSEYTYNQNRWYYKIHDYKIPLKAFHDTPMGSNTKLKAKDV
jgi:hypothetical protein